MKLHRNSFILNIDDPTLAYDRGTERNLPLFSFVRRRTESCDPAHSFAHNPDVGFQSCEEGGVIFWVIRGSGDPMEFRAGVLVHFAVFKCISAVYEIYYPHSRSGSLWALYPAPMSRWCTKEAVMRCPLCQSPRELAFPAEMIIHFSGLRNVDKPGVWVFPLLRICLDCGHSPFTVPVAELAQLARGQ